MTYERFLDLYCDECDEQDQPVKVTVVSTDTSWRHGYADDVVLSLADGTHWRSWVSISKNEGLERSRVAKVTQVVPETKMVEVTVWTSV